MVVVVAKVHVEKGSVALVSCALRKLSMMWFAFVSLVEVRLRRLLPK